MIEWTVNPLEAMDDPGLFGPYFNSPSWDAWRSFVAALNGLPMTESQLASYRQHTGRYIAPTVPFDEAAVVCGRRSGKSQTMAMLGTCIATMKDYRPYLSPGEIGKLVILASDKDQAQVIFNYIAGYFDAIPALSGMRTNQVDRLIELGRQRVEIEVKAASMRGIRGFTMVSLIADEAAFWPNENSVNPDTEILAAVRPAFATIPGAMLLMASSPYSKRGELYTAYRDYYGRDDADVLVWKASTREMNPGISQKQEDRAYAKDPFRASAEWGGNFRNDISALVSREVVEACIEPGCRERPPAGHTYFGFTDPSGGSSDSFALAIAHRENEKAVLDCLREIRAPFSPDDATREIAETLKRYGLRTVTGDRYSGEWCRERFRVHGIEYLLSDKPKSDLYRDTVPMLNAGTAELLDIPVLVNQLCNLERRTARGGRDSIDHPQGSGHHDDCANVVAGALRQVDLKKDDDRIWAKCAGYTDAEYDAYRAKKVSMYSASGNENASS